MKRSAKEKPVSGWVVLYWLGGSWEDSPASLRSTGAYPRHYGETTEEGRRTPPKLDQLESELSLNGYSTKILPLHIALTILSRRDLLFKNEKQRKAPRAKKVEKRKRKPAKHSPFVPFSDRRESLATQFA